MNKARVTILLCLVWGAVSGPFYLVELLWGLLGLVVALVVLALIAASIKARSPRRMHHSGSVSKLTKK